MRGEGAVVVLLSVPFRKVRKAYTYARTYARAYLTKTILPKCRTAKKRTDSKLQLFYFMQYLHHLAIKLR